MKLLITGAAGFVGANILQEAMARGHQVIALTRTSSPSEWSNIDGLEILHCDLSSYGSLDLVGRGIDGVIHLAASLKGSAEEQRDSTIGGTSNLFDAMKGAGIHRLVGISSMSVLDYSSIPSMETVDEDSPKCSDKEGIGIYAALKSEQEEMFSSFSSEPDNQCVILRPGLIYDETHLISAHAGIMKGSIQLFASHKGEVPVVSVSSIAGAILNAIEGDIKSGEIINLVDDSLPNQEQYIEALQRRSIIKSSGVTLPWSLLKMLVSMAYGLAKAVGLKGRLPELLLPKSFAARMKPFTFSNKKAKNVLYWVPDNSFH